MYCRTRISRLLTRGFSELIEWFSGSTLSPIGVKFKVHLIRYRTIVRHPMHPKVSIPLFKSQKQLFQPWTGQVQPMNFSWKILPFRRLQLSLNLRRFLRIESFNFDKPRFTNWCQIALKLEDLENRKLFFIVTH